MSSDASRPEPIKRRGAVAKIDPIDFRLAIEAGFSSGEIAAMFGISAPSVISFCKQEGLPMPARANGGRRAADAVPPVMPTKADPTPPPIDERKASLTATVGRYADLRAWAQRWGVTEIKARQEWHALRLPISKGRSL